MNIQLQEWFNENMPDKDLIYGEGMKNQVMWVRDCFAYMIYKSLSALYPTEKEWIPISTVEGTHRSKSVILPVYCFEYDDIKIKLRGNFHDWCVAYWGPDIIEFPAWMDVYEAQGFYEGMGENDANISFCVRDKEKMYSIVWWMLNNIKPEEL